MRGGREGRRHAIGYVDYVMRMARRSAWAWATQRFALEAPLPPDQASGMKSSRSCRSSSGFSSAAKWPPCSVHVSVSINLRARERGRRGGPHLGVPAVPDHVARRLDPCYGARHNLLREPRVAKRFAAPVLCVAVEVLVSVLCVELLSVSRLVPSH